MPHGSELLLAFLLMFVAQILTLITGIASIFLNRKILALAPVLLSLIVTASMTCADFLLMRSADVFSTFSYQPGYLLTYPSMFLFIVAFMLTLRSKASKQEHEQPHSKLL
jgi:hypothetical protein